MSMKLSQKFITIGSVLITILLVLLCIKLVVDISQARDMVENPRDITVQGEGEVQAVPDTTEFSFTVIGQDASSQAALREASEKLDQALAAIRRNGVEERDIQTSSFTTNPRYAYDEGRAPRIVGYESNQTITVKVREAENAGEIIAALTDAGVDQVSGLELSVEEDEGFQREAREKAIDDAREEAKLLAEDLGVSLGEVVSFRESHNNTPIHYDRFEAAESSAAPQIPVGENTYRSTVEITFRIH